MKKSKILSPETIGGRVRKYRLDAGYTIKDFADMLGISANHLGLVERGKKEASFKLLQKVAEITNTPYQQIIKGDVENKLDTQLNNLLKLISFLDNPQNEAKVLTHYARLTLALTELQRAMNSTPNTPEQISLFATFCCNCFADLQDAIPENSACDKDALRELSETTHEFNELIATYSKLNTTRRKVVTDVANAMLDSQSVNRN